MKTTIEIPDPLLAKAKEVAKEEGSTLKEMVEEGLRLVLRARDSQAPYTATPVVFKGEGLSPEFAGGGWERIREAAYEGHGA